MTAVPLRFTAILTLAVTLHTGGCAWYSFSGASIPEHLQTIAVPLVENNTISTVTGLGDDLTALLVDRFVRQTRLSLEPAEAEADAVLTATITRYNNAPTSVSGNDQATRNRVTIAVNVAYRDQVQDRMLLERSFNGFEDYDPLDQSLEAVAAQAALEKIADDIFTAATSNW